MTAVTGDGSHGSRGSYGNHGSHGSHGSHRGHGSRVHAARLSRGGRAGRKSRGARCAPRARDLSASYERTLRVHATSARYECARGGPQPRRARAAGEPRGAARAASARRECERIREEILGAGAGTKKTNTLKPRGQKLQSQSGDGSKPRLLGKVCAFARGPFLRRAAFWGGQSAKAFETRPWGQARAPQKQTF